MNDRDIEELLARYRPATRLPDFPVTRLGDGRTWPWMVAAAALLAVSIGLHAAVVPAPEPSSLVDAARVQAIADELGGDADSRIMAEWIVRREAASERERQPLRSYTDPERQ